MFVLPPLCLLRPSSSPVQGSDNNYAPRQYRIISCLRRWQFYCRRRNTYAHTSPRACIHTKSNANTILYNMYNTTYDHTHRPKRARILRRNIITIWHVVVARTHNEVKTCKQDAVFPWKPLSAPPRLAWWPSSWDVCVCVCVCERPWWLRDRVFWD